MDRGSIARTILETARPATHSGPVRGTPTRPGSRKVPAATESVPKWPSRRSTRVPAQAEHPGNARVSVSALELFHIHRRRDKTDTPQGPPHPNLLPPGEYLFSHHCKMISPLLSKRERRRSPQATLNTHPGEGITSLYENISVRFSFSVRLLNERCRRAVDVPWQRRAHRHLPGRRAARVPSREVEISDRSARRRLAGDARQGHLLRK